MYVYVKGLSAVIYQHINEECPRLFMNKVKNEDGTYDVYLNEYSILKTSMNELKIELGLHTYYLEATDFVKVEIC